ncbi:BPSL0761 family protein [Pseudomonas oryzihabitans]|uniref:BPSL0761 family protein n=1 Tax=Pseudomonas oryzihabitans TaxID=47885 RepID=UPI00286C693E|nr:BPSL0761 family protein [Pseudomonas psychrotolerans]
MTTTEERTRSVAQTETFLRELARDPAMPTPIRERARGLLRHYPSPDQIWQAGRLETLRREEVATLAEAHGPLPPALASWLLIDPLFCSGQVDSE